VTKETLTFYKRCTVCGTFKKLDDFGWRNRGKYLKSECKVCGNKEARDYARRNPDKIKVIKARYHASEKGKETRRRWREQRNG